MRLYVVNLIYRPSLLASVKRRRIESFATLADSTDAAIARARDASEPFYRGWRFVGANAHEQSDDLIALSSVTR